MALESRADNIFATVPNEHEEQVALIEWAAKAHWRWPELAGLVAVPNFSGHIGAMGIRYHTGKRLKAEGRRAGYPDLMLDVGRGGYLGWRGEMKRRAPGAIVRDPQRLWHERLRAQGYKVDVRYGFEHMRLALIEYLVQPQTPTPHRLIDERTLDE